MVRQINVCSSGSVGWLSSLIAEANHGRVQTIRLSSWLSLLV